MPECLVDLCKVCWSRDERDRPSFDEIQEYLEIDVKRAVMEQADGTGSPLSKDGLLGKGAGGSAGSCRRTSTSGKLALRKSMIQGKIDDVKDREKANEKDLIEKDPDKHSSKTKEELRARIEELERQNRLAQVKIKALKDETSLTGEVSPANSLNSTPKADRNIRTSVEELKNGNFMNILS